MRTFLIAAGLIALSAGFSTADVDEELGIILYKRTPSQLEADARRKADIQKCASCHMEVYEQWKKGPHAHAFENVSRAVRELMLKQIRDGGHEGPLAELPARQAKKLIKEHYKSKCVDCHTPSKVVYEDGIKPEWNGKGEVRSNDFEERSWLALTTGVDCITCHRSGERVVTRPDYAPPEGFVPPEGFCNPLPSKVFAHIYNCVSCHTEIVLGYEKEFNLAADERQAPFLRCETCHMQQGPDGRGTHYYYWGARADKIKDMLVPLFDDVSFIVREEGGKKSLSVDWETDSMPHQFMPYTPKLYMFTFDVLDPEGKTVFSTLVRFFESAEDEGRTRELVRSYNTTGELVELKPGETFRRRYELPASLGTAGTVRLTIVKKSEYKKTDDEGDLVYKREEKFSL